LLVDDRSGFSDCPISDRGRLVLGDVGIVVGVEHFGCSFVHLGRLTVMSLDPAMEPLVVVVLLGALVLGLGCFSLPPSRVTLAFAANTHASSLHALAVMCQCGSDRKLRGGPGHGVSRREPSAGLVVEGVFRHRSAALRATKDRPTGRWSGFCAHERTAIAASELERCHCIMGDPRREQFRSDFTRGLHGHLGLGKDAPGSAARVECCPSDGTPIGVVTVTLGDVHFHACRSMRKKRKARKVESREWPTRTGVAPTRDAGASVTRFEAAVNRRSPELRESCRPFGAT
jgi:hypothetical protein